MLDKYAAVCYEHLRPAQVQAIREKTPIAYIVAGSLEWHSFHNPLGTDSLKGHAVCCEAALKYGGVVLPPFYQGLLRGTNWGPEGWVGYTLSFTELEMFESAILGITRALVYGDWRVVVGVTGHDNTGQRYALARAIELGTRGTASVGFAVMEGEMHVPGEEIPLQMDHAAAWETSCMLYAYPEDVDLDTLRSRQLSSDEDFKMSGPEGIGGKNPLKYSSAEMGQKIVERMGDLIGARASTMLADLRRRG